MTANGSRPWWRRAARLPLGAGALAGVNFDTDRRAVAAALGFTGVAENSIDAVSNRDFVLDYLSAAATCATHLSRLGAELVLWSSEEFGFCEVSDAWASGSSIMPQKKNPDAAELLRAKAPRVVANLSALHGVMHGLPLTYNKDMQEDKERLFDSCDTLELCLDAADGMISTITFDRERAGRRGIGPDAGRDRRRRPAGPPRDAVPRGPRRRRRARAGRGRRAASGCRSSRARSWPSSRRCSTTSSTRCWPTGRGWRARCPRAGRASSACASSCSARVRRLAEPRAAASGGTAAAFYERPVVEVAQALVGCVVSHGECAGVIVETEAYHESEPACHAYVGVTARTEPLFGPPGIAYVYRSYGIHALLNAVCEPAGVGAGVLIRALEPIRGHRADARAPGGLPDRQLCSGPGKLTQALGIELSHNRIGPARPARS